MSPRESTAHERMSAARAADRARGAEPHRSDPMLATVHSARVGTPELVRSPDETPAYWLVPFVEGELACGFARVELDGRVSQLGTFGAGAGDRRSWPESIFFEAPPQQFLEELERVHPGAAIHDALLTYDRSPEHWGWRVDLGASGAAFLTPGGWHMRSRT